MVTAGIIALGALLGLVCGSFANVLIYRLPRGESILWPGSHCPACSAPIPWYLNVPVLSWLALRGRCSACKAPISPRYPLVELGTGILFGLCAAAWGASFQTASGCLLCLVLVPLGLIDLEHQILPDKLTYPGMVAGAALSVLPRGMGWQASLIGLAVGALVPALVLLTYWLVRREEGMGWGDVKLLALIGAFLGWRGVLFVVFAGALAGTVIGGAYLFWAGKGRKTPLPFGTFLSAAALVGLFGSEPAWRWYTGLIALHP